MFQVLDHHTRRNEQEGRVVGALLGSVNSDGTVQVGRACVGWRCRRTRERASARVHAHAHARTWDPWTHAASVHACMRGQTRATGDRLRN